MALNNSSKIVTDGLVFAYDMANTAKSWKGAPVTNKFTLPTGDTNGFGVQNDTFTRVRSGNYGGYEIKPSDYVWKYTMNGASRCPYHGWDIPTTSGNVVTFSFDYFVDDSTTGYPLNNYLANMENAGSGTSGSVTDPNPSVIGVWKRAYFSRTATATGNSRCLLYPGGCSSDLATSGFILFKNPQVEFNAPGSVPTPFVAGTRSNTQAIVDLTGNNTITSSSLTYNNDGSFSFDNVNDFIDTNFPAQTIYNCTICAWVYDNTADTNYRAIVQNNIASDDALYVNPSNYLMWWPATASTLTVPKNAWTFVAASHTYGSGILYQVNDTQQFISGTFADPTDWDFLRIGGHSTGDGERWGGYIPVVNVYNRALTSTELQQNFNALRGRYGI